MKLPNRIFFTGVPGSRWSGIAQHIERIPGFNTSDRTPEREYAHNQYTGHKGAYFGRGMEFEAYVTGAELYIDNAWTEPGGTRIVKSHDWAYRLDEIKQEFPDDWIMLVYRPDLESFAWWHQAGGFNIKYPCYDAYKDSTNMMSEITKQNKSILEFAFKHDATWRHFNSKWCEDNFGHAVAIDKVWPDILVTIIK